MRPIHRCRRDRFPSVGTTLLLIALWAGSWEGRADARPLSEDPKPGGEVGQDRKDAPATPTFKIVKIDPPEATLGEDIFLDVGDLPPEWLEKDRLNEAKLV